MAKELSLKEHTVAVSDWTPEQLKLITEVVAKNATPEELKLFLYRCKNMGLDPLKPGQIYFIKFNSSQPGTMVVGIDGFRSLASRTGKHMGTVRGIIRDDKGRCIGAWAEVHRSDWKHPAREEVSLGEYNTGKSQWARMPETMIKKVAEVAALRMAFPDDLGGIYAPEEMEQANQHQPPETQRTQPVLVAKETVPVEPAEYVISVTKEFLGKKIKELPLDKLTKTVSWYMDELAQGKRFTEKHMEFLEHATKYLEAAQMAQAPAQENGDGIPF